MPGANVDLIESAIRYAEDKHKDQKRKDGSPYIIHPLAVAEVVLEMGLDVDAVLGAILHDCIEDTDASFDDIAKLFGRTAAELVEGVTKLTRADFSSTEEAQMENLRKMFMAMSKDIRVVLIKIADRLHNIKGPEATAGSIFIFLKRIGTAVPEMLERNIATKSAIPVQRATERAIVSVSPLSKYK